MPLPKITAAKELRSDYGKWLIHGPQGSGKTLQGTSIAGCGPTLYVDLPGEKGARSFAGAKYEDNISVTRPQSITDLDDLYWYLAAGDHPYKAVVIDSLTSVQKMAMRFMLGHSETAVKEIKLGTAPATQQTWGQTLDVMQDFATFWFGLADGDRRQPMHVVMTAQTKIDKNEIDGEKTRTIDVQKGALSIVKATPDYILYTDVESNDDAIGDDEQPAVRHIVRFGANPDYSTKARVPVTLQGRIPSILGRSGPIPDLVTLSQILGIGGVPKRASKKTAEQPQEG